MDLQTLNTILFCSHAYVKFVVVCSPGFPVQVIQIQTETQQNLQKEMQKMQQKFKTREDKAKKEHREEMGQVTML